MHYFSFFFDISQVQEECNDLCTIHTVIENKIKIKLKKSSDARQTQKQIKAQA